MGFFMKFVETSGFRKANSKDYGSYLDKGNYRIKSLSGQDLVLVPVPETGNAQCNQLANFVKGKSKDQKKVQQLFWRNVGEAILDSVANVTSGEIKKFYLNTHGKAVPWTHMRLDDGR